MEQLATDSGWYSKPVPKFKTFSAYGVFQPVYATGALHGELPLGNNLRDSKNICTQPSKECTNAF